MPATEVIVSILPNCDICTHVEGRTDPNKAWCDGATILGPWAYMCMDHYMTHGRGLGMGRGQKLILKKD